MNAEKGGGIWVATLISGPVIGYLLGSSVMLDWSESSWRWRNILWIALGAGAPIATALAHTRQLGILVVSALVGLTTYGGVRNLVTGPRVEETIVNEIVCQNVERHGSSCIEYRLVAASTHDVRAEPTTLKGIKPKDHVRITKVDDIALRVERL